MNPKHILAKAALAIAVASVSVTAFATHQWGTYHWGSTTSPFTLQVLDSTVAGGANANWPALLSVAMSEWSQSSKLDFNVVPYANDSRSRKRCTAVSGKIRVCNAAYGNNGWLGLASINLSGDHITQGTAKMNDSYASTYASDPNEARHVMCQEVGHDFGLDHQSTTQTLNTCMDYSSSPNSVSPNAHDYAELDIIYGHIDSSNTHAFRATANQSTMTGNVPMGVMVRRDHFSETYVAPDGRGGLWVHHVYLAPGFEHLDAQ